MRLLETIENSSYHLLTIGKQSLGSIKYYKRVMVKIRGNEKVSYIEQIPNEKLYALYKQCKISVLNNK